MSNKHIALQIILGTITEVAIVAYTAYKILCLIGSVLEWICCNMLSSTTAVGIGIMLVVLMCALIAMYTPSDEGGGDNHAEHSRRD